MILPRQGRKGNVKGGGDRAEEFVFFDVNFAVGGDDGGRGDEEALLDGRAGGGEFVEREVAAPAANAAAVSPGLAWASTERTVAISGATAWKE